MKKVSLKLKSSLSPVLTMVRNPNRSLKIFISLLIVTIFIILSGGCLGTDLQNGTHSNFIIACTIPPQEEFIRAITGNEEVSVLVMVPQGASPHTFEPTPSQIAALEKADLYLSLGSGIEFENRWLSKIQNQYPKLLIVNTSKNVHFLPASHDSHDAQDMTDFIHENGNTERNDPHVWVSLRNAALIINESCDAISGIRPEMKNSFEINRDVYLRKLSDLDNTILQSLKDRSSQIILVYHPAFGYLCRDYNLTQLSVEENGQEPSAQKLAEIVTRAKEEGIEYVFTEPESSTREAETLAREINGTIILISPLASDYLENMHRVAQKISGTL
jgi:zinc transport system substrate-binding protein